MCMNFNGTTCLPKGFIVESLQPAIINCKYSSIGNTFDSVKMVGLTFYQKVFHKYQFDGKSARYRTLA